MSKNLTRKGLAFGALVALGSSVIAGAPANAAATLTIAPSAGTTYNTLSGEAFTVKAFPNVDLADAKLAKLAFKVTNTAGLAITYTATDSLSGTKAEVVDGTSTTAGDGTSDVVKADWTTNGSAVNYLTIDPTISSTTKNGSVTVQAFIDEDSSGSITDGDTLSAAQVINWYNGADVTATVTLDPIVVGSAPVASFTLAKGTESINLRQVTAASTSVRFQENGANFGTGNSAAFSNASGYRLPALNADKNALKATAASNAAASKTYKASVYVQRYDSDATGTAEWPAIGSASSDASAGADTATATLTLANSAVVRDRVSTDLPVTTTVGTGTAVGKVLKKGTLAATISAEVKANANTAVAAGSKVVVKVEEKADGSIAAATKITAGGKELTDATSGSVDSISYVATTDASGKFDIALSSNNGTVDDHVVVTITSGTVTSAALDIQWKAAVAKTLVEKGTPGGVVATTKTASIPFSFELFDDFGQTWTDATTSYQVVLTGTGSGSAAFTTPVALSAGKASISFVDNSTTTGSYNLTATSQVLTGTSWGNITTVGALVIPIEVVSAKNAVTAVSATAYKNDGTTISTSEPLVGKTLVSGDFRGGNLGATAAYGTNGVQISGTVRDANGATVAGAEVKISAAGFGFASGVYSTSSNVVLAIDSITVKTDASGVYVASVYSNKSGKSTFTVTSGTGTKTVDITFTGAAISKASKFVVTAPASTTPGRAVDVVFTLTDKYGAIVNTTAAGSNDDKLSVKLTGGIGYIANEPAAWNTDDAGQFTVRVIFGSNENGTAVVTATYDADGTNEGAGLANQYTAVSGVATIAVAAPAAVVVEPTSKIGTANGRVYVNVKDGKGSVVTVKIGSKWSTKTALNNDYTFSYKNKKGAKVSVKVYVDGDLSASKTITVK